MNESKTRTRHVAPSVAAVASTISVGEREELWRDYILRTAQGDRDAFSALYDATSSLVYSLVVRIIGDRADAEEITVDVYTQAWREARRFDPTRGGAGAWLVTIARSRALDKYRSRESRNRWAALAMNESTPASVSPEDLSTLNENRRTVAGAMASLSPEQRQAIELAYFRGMTQSEIAEFLRVPLGTVKTRVRLGMMRLRDAISESRG